MNDDKINNLLKIVIENYIHKGEPIGSKFLHSLEHMDYAPSTLRKYLNLLEKDGLVYQPYNSSGRIPTVEGIQKYIDEIMSEKNSDFDEINFDTDYARNGMRYVVESLGNHVDGVVVGFLRNDEYYFLGINNLMKDNENIDYDITKHIIGFIEEKKIVEFLHEKIIKAGKIYYSFIHSDDGTKTISCLYTRSNVNGYDWIVSIVWPLRINYKKNLWILRKFLQSL